MRKKAVLLLLLALFAVFQAGCSYKQEFQRSDSDYGSRKNGDPKNSGVQSYGKASSNPNQHQNVFFEYSSALSKKVTALNGVAAANVMLTDKNAYVAIMLDWTAVGTKSTGGIKEQNNTGTNEGVYNIDSGTPYGNGRVAASPYNSFFTVSDHNQLSHELKQTIADLIRADLPMVQEVHISANMEFVNYFNEFAKEAWGGRSLAPWTDSFNTVVQYYFDGGSVMPKPITQPGRVSPQDWQMVKPH
ncbi:hypothetical protein A7K91_24890 [Paenibacillus oryzae]|jgi:hypothetical protein|uniref:Uncharacterized protein n=1 Tax=Paenibacillus oryzae TaxID=1844972 RepID=A0A1A5YC76_9BACL|nr:YhcN/YlaJ family sporulation lipoprotein [Paenibacillus oryzae]OBR63197.1 hypothetical protein A7K91_24890 [Paenibacillus oryzae]